MKKFEFIMLGIGISAAVYALSFGMRTYHNIQRKRETVNTYAIVNAETGMAIRVYNAGIADETKIIQYKHANWECMTWQMIKLSDGSTLLKNLYTHKTFEPSDTPAEGVALWQKPLEAGENQYWEFIETDGGSYYIRLKGTDLYITTNGSENNSSLTLMTKQDNKVQQWVLKEQHPIV